jgi:hypothetical protein
MGLNFEIPTRIFCRPGSSSRRKILTDSRLRLLSEVRYSIRRSSSQNARIRASSPSLALGISPEGPTCMTSAELFKAIHQSDDQPKAIPLA